MNFQPAVFLRFFISVFFYSYLYAIILLISFVNKGECPTNRKITLPPLGNRIIKTAVAVFICLLLHMAVGYRGSVMQSAIAAVICLQPNTTDSRTYAIERIFGTVLGSVWGFAYLFLLILCPRLDDHMIVAYTLMALFVMLALYSAVLLKKSAAAALVAIVFLGTVVSYPDVDATPLQAVGTVLDTMVGTLVAVFVNAAHAPRLKHKERLFFVRTMDLVPDRYTNIPSSVHYMLDKLYNDGARICLISRWAPAFIISQMGLLNVNAPVIVMDGAGLYDIGTNKYLDIVEIPKEHAERLRHIIEGFGSGCSFYTVHDRTLCIYRDGPISKAEAEEYKIMKKSPYRNYLEGNYHDDDKIAFMRVTDTPERIGELEYLVKSVLPGGMFRVENRTEAQFPDYRGLYFYHPDANVPAMKKKVLEMLEKEENTKLEAVDILPKLRKYEPEHDALLLLSRLKNAYEPVSLKAVFKKS